MTQFVATGEIDEARVRNAARLCFFAHYHENGWVSQHTRYYLEALRDAGFVTVVISTAKLTPDALSYLRHLGAEIVVRDNIGMDFGGWIEACMRFFPINADLLLLANDSVYGPIGNLSLFIDKLLMHEADFYGAVDSLEIALHLQSWFILLKPQAYRSAAFAGLMCTPMRMMPDKLALVTQYEIGLSQQLIASGLRYHAAFSIGTRQGLARHYPYNPAHLLWRQMIEAGVPFIKVELLRLNRMRVTNGSSWKSILSNPPSTLSSMIQEDLDHRGVAPMPGFWSMSKWSLIYWPELRSIILSDYASSRDGAGWIGIVHLRALQIVALLAMFPRRLYARFSAIKASRRTG